MAKLKGALIAGVLLAAWTSAARPQEPGFGGLGVFAAPQPFFLSVPLRILGIETESVEGGQGPTVPAADETSSEPEITTGSIKPSLPPPKGPAAKLVGQGVAVWYAHPGRTASGETFNPRLLTAAHRTLPFGTTVRVVNRSNGKGVVVRINDRLGAKALRQRGLVIDLSREAARRLDIRGRGRVALYLAGGPTP